jgi:hypothetical protein
MVQRLPEIAPRSAVERNDFSSALVQAAIEAYYQSDETT